MFICGCYERDWGCLTLITYQVREQETTGLEKGLEKVFERRKRLWVGYLPFQKKSVAMERDKALSEAASGV